MTTLSTRSLMAAVCLALSVATTAVAAEKAAAPAETATPAHEATLMPAIEMPTPEEDDPRARIALIPKTVVLHDSDEKVPIFTDVLQVKDAFRKYPFLREVMPGMRPNNPLRLGRQQFGDVTLLYFFLNLRDEQGVCGSLGCPMTVWADEGFGYHNVMDILKKYFTGVFVRSKGGKLSMIFCDPVRGQSNWDFEKGTFKHKGVNQDAPDCQDTSENAGEPEPALMKGADEPEVEETPAAEDAKKTAAEPAEKPNSGENPKTEEKTPVTP